uniref:G_PROTEIN_RECEP_F1_2 domain-containing protein n=1 Tax=Schistosoma mansoni TaxID=6183 RepID=A0A3Q0KQ19_SCHMA
MSYTNETNLQFSFTFYYYVYYLGNCEDIINPNKYNKPMSLPEKWQQLPILCLTFIAFLMNAITLFIFIFGEFTINHLSSMNEPKSRATSSILSKNKSKLHGRSRSSFLTSLIILSIFEVIFNLFTFLFKLIEIFSPNFIHQIPLDPKNHIPPDMKLLIIPVIQNIIMFIADIGLMCRNWCICLITIARAEVVIWPLGSKLWQRILRNPRRFKLIFMIFFVISMIISAFKHTDYIGQLCYDEQYKKYSLWSEEYFWTYENFSKYMTFIVLPYQAVIPWFIITIFTILILFRLKPWKHDKNLILFCDNTKSLDDIPDIQGSQPSPPPPQQQQQLQEQQQRQQQCCIQQDALRKRQQGQMKATRIVLCVAIIFGLLECMNFIISICQTIKILPNNYISRILETIGNTLIVIDSICNFFVFITMMLYFRQLFTKIFLCKEFINHNNNNNNTTNSCSSSNVSQKNTSYTSIN